MFELGIVQIFFWVLRPRVYFELLLYKCDILIQIFAKIVDIFVICDTPLSSFATGAAAAAVVVVLLVRQRRRRRRHLVAVVIAGGNQ